MLNEKPQKKKSFLGKSFRILVTVIVIIFVWNFIKDKVSDVVSDDINDEKSIYYLSDEKLSELLSGSQFYSRMECQVIRVADGDTIDVDCPFKQKETIRYAYLDTPEVWKKVNGKWEEDNQCFGKEASSINKKLVEDKKVLLFDPLPYKDPYDRRISNVIIKEGKDKNLYVNSFLIGQGYAKVYEQPNPIFKMFFYTAEENFKKLEKISRDNNMGLWGKCN